MIRCLILLISILWSTRLIAQEAYKQYVTLNYEDIDSIAAEYYEKGAYAKAIPFLQAARVKAQQEFGEQDSTFATYTNILGRVYEKMGQYDRVLLLYTKAKNIREKVLGREHPEFIESINNLAVFHYLMGNYDQALPLFIQARNIEERVLGRQHAGMAVLLNNLALVYVNLSNYDQALPLYIQSKNIVEKTLGKSHPRFANALNNLAILYVNMGDYEKALPLYIQSKNIVEKTLGKSHPRFANALNSLGHLYANRGDYNRALLFYKEAKDVAQDVLDENHPDLAAFFNNLADVYKQIGDYEAAASLYRSAKNIYEIALGKEHPFLANTLNNLADLAKSKGDYPQAWDYLYRAMNITSTINIAHNFDASWSDSLKSVAYPSNEHITHMLYSLALAYSLLQKDSMGKAIQKQTLIADVALNLLDKLRNQVASEKDKLRMLKQSNEWLLRSLKVLEASAQANKAFHLADENKSVLLLQATKSEASYRLGELPDSLIWQDKTLRKKQSQLQAKLLQNRTETEKDSLINELNELNQEIEAFLRMIEENYPKYHALKYQQVDAKAEEIQALLDEKTALLEYVIADSTVHIFRVDKKSVSWHQEAVLDSTLSAKIKAFHGSLSNYRAIMENQAQSYQNYTELAHWFYQKLLLPVLKGDDGIENLIIVSDGELGHLPFESFLVEPAPEEASYKDLHYLLKDFNVSYSYSATLWKENKTAEARENNGELLALAARYSENLDSALLRSRLPAARQMREGLQPLPAARREVEVLSEQYQGYFAFDSLATERILREKAGDYAIIHLATHGLLDEKRPILSSLALTEDGDSLYDNFWQAHEISKMEINAHLVVLSACETGYGRFEKGNGIASLARSFMYAGVPSLVVSLWQVNDASTSAIMQHFYAHLAEGLDKAQALREAKLDYITESKNPAMAHPAFWSPFILIGDAKPVELQERGRSNWGWYVAGGAALLLLFLGFLRARRG